MLKYLPTRPLLAVIAFTLSACAGPDPVSYGGLASSAQLRPNIADESGHIPFRYSSHSDLRRYSAAILDPVVIYASADNQLGDLSAADRADLAAYMQTRFAAALARRFRIAAGADPETLRIRLTLTGAATNTAVASTFTHLDLAGNLYNGIQAVRGGEGMMAGSVSYAVEIFDAKSNRLLEAFVTKQYPGAFNIGASFGSLAAAETGIDKGADALIEMLN